MGDGIFPASFWPLALAHGLALLSPGPDFMLIVSHGLRYGWAGSGFICLGIALGNGVYIGLAIAGLAWLGADSPLYAAMEVIGAAYLAWMGIRLVKSADGPPPPVDGGARRIAVPSQFAMGLGSALLNPKNMVFYLTIMTVLIEGAATVSQRVAAGIWMCGVVLAWDLFLAGAVAHAGIRRCLWRQIPRIEMLCGLVLLFLSLSLIVMSLS